MNVYYLNKHRLITTRQLDEPNGTSEVLLEMVLNALLKQAISQPAH